MVMNFNVEKPKETKSPSLPTSATALNAQNILAGALGSVAGVPNFTQKTTSQGYGRTI